MPLFTVILDLRPGVRYVHIDIEAPDSPSAAIKVLDTHKERNSLSQVEIHVFPNSSMESYTVRQDNSFQLLEQ